MTINNVRLPTFDFPPPSANNGINNVGGGKPMNLSEIKNEAISITENIIKLGVIATLSTMINNVYKVQSNSTIQHIASDIKLISDGN